MKVAFTLKKASKDDLDALRTEGCVFFLKSVYSGKFDPRPYFMHSKIDKEEFNQLYTQGSVYLPSDFEELSELQD